MKKTFILFSLAALSFAACGTHTQEQGTEQTAQVADTTLMYFGDTITADGAVPATNLMASLSGKDSLKIKLTGTIEEVCQKKGCWMTLGLGDGKNMRVSFKDYAFFMPKDAAGKTVTIEGYAYNDTIPVAQLKHYAEDAKKSKEEIAQITQPEVSISFEANGVILKK